MRYCVPFVFVMAVFMTYTVAANGQMYEYRDAEGNIRITDNLGNVPENRRENAQKIQQIPRDLSALRDEALQENDDDRQQLETDIDLVKKGDTLRQEQAELREEYESIQEAKANAKRPASDASDAEWGVYVQKAEELNRRIESYQEKLQDHEIRVNEYNAMFEE